MKGAREQRGGRPARRCWRDRPPGAAPPGAEVRVSNEPLLASLPLAMFSLLLQAKRGQESHFPEATAPQMTQRAVGQTLASEPEVLPASQAASSRKDNVSPQPAPPKSEGGLFEILKTTPVPLAAP